MVEFASFITIFIIKCLETNFMNINTRIKLKCKNGSIKLMQ